MKKYICEEDIIIQLNNLLKKLERYDEWTVCAVIEVIEENLISSLSTITKADIYREFADKLIEYFSEHASEVYNHVCARDFICDRIDSLAEMENEEK